MGDRHTLSRTQTGPGSSHVNIVRVDRVGRDSRFRGHSTARAKNLRLTVTRPTGVQESSKTASKDAANGSCCSGNDRCAVVLPEACDRNVS